jgi:hypothetical protein
MNPVAKLVVKQELDLKAQTRKHFTTKNKIDED